MKTNEKNMTSGNIVKTILLFAIPIFIGNIFQQIYTIVDTSVAGHYLGDNAIAAIGATGGLYGLIINLAWGLNCGFAVVLTRNFGEKKIKKIQKNIAAMTTLDIFFTLLLTVVALLFLKPFMHLLNTPKEIFQDAYSYIAIIFAGMIGTILYDMATGIMRAFGNSKTPMNILIFCSILNIFLDILLVAGLKVGVKGTAIATILSQIVSGIISGIYVIKKYPKYLPTKKDFHLEKGLVKEMMATGISMSLMYSIVNIGSVIFQSATNTLGEVIIAANTTSDKIIGTLMGPTASIMDSTATFVGQNYGANKKERVKLAIKEAIKIEVIWGIIATLIVYGFGKEIVKMMTGSTQKEMVQYANMNMRIALPFFPILGILLVQRTSMQAMGQKIEPIISSVIEVGMRAIGAFVMVPILGYLGVCWNTPITWTVMTIYMLIIYKFKTKKKYLTEQEG